MDLLYSTIQNAFGWMTRPSIPESVKNIHGVTECVRTTNNQNFNCPALMSDGRHFTSYESASDYHYKLGKELNLETQREFRTHAQQNGKLYKNYIESFYDTKECVGDVVPLPPPARVYEITDDGIKYYDTGLPNGIGLMEKTQWEEVVKMERENLQKVRRERKVGVSDCTIPVMRELAKQEDILRINRMSLYGGVPGGLYHQNF
jgi:hypothetical protein